MAHQIPHPPVMNLLHMQPSVCESRLHLAAIVSFKVNLSFVVFLFSEIEKAIGKLQKNHLRHMQVYDPLGGDENKRRLGEKYYQFTHGVGKHDVSIKIPHKVNNAKMGYLEDRRPSSNGDPYAICNAIVRTCLLDE